MKFSVILLLVVLSTVNALPRPGYPIAESYPIVGRSESDPKQPDSYPIAGRSESDPKQPDSYPIAERSESNPKQPDSYPIAERSE
ncbi:ovarian abundant message protein-like [Gigaspora margarita]|uniref:Ovarian abundant message protein-like n=1 Tax=Gigaspora margarita TaxID=4874 RepID=A0A8H4ASR9_GIGMA|nr:ovarian abundant message protein-like [Gigaspora margarita]